MGQSGVNTLSVDCAASLAAARLSARRQPRRRL